MSVPATRPSRSPFVATAIGVGVLLLVVIALSILVSPLAGGLLLAIGLVLTIVHIAMRPEGQLRDAALDTVPASERVGRKRMLVVADAPLSGDEPAARIRETAGDDPQLDVVAPVLVSQTHFAMSDRDREMADAHRRLEATLAWAREHGFTATGTIGSDDPETAMADALRRSGAEAVLFVSRGEDDRTRLEERALRRADAELAIPVVHVTV
ncbi:MAG TPA: hypothetical protein VFS37_12785 [Conexibacter sp.]|nr:hypothetical protein [Conexibacter sp.]